MIMGVAAREGAHPHDHLARLVSGAGL